jgi:lysyl-tRNA synthetase class 2
MEEKEQKSTQMPEEEILSQRREKLERLRNEEGYDPFVQERFLREHSLAHVLETYADFRRTSTRRTPGSSPPVAS